MPHPAVLILFWACITLAMQLLQTTALMLAGLPLLIATYAVSAAHLLTLLRRTRWIMLSLLLIYAYATPGEAAWTALAQFSPTHEGLADGALQLCRLFLALAALSILLGLLPLQQLIGGLYTLGYPMRYAGLSRERIAVRLALTLHYAESSMLDAATDWRGSIQQALAAGKERGCIELQTSPLTQSDAMLLVAGCALLVLMLI